MKKHIGVASSSRSKAKAKVLPLRLGKPYERQHLPSLGRNLDIELQTKPSRESQPPSWSEDEKTRITEYGRLALSYTYLHYIEYRKYNNRGTYANVVKVILTVMGSGASFIGEEINDQFSSTGTIIFICVGISNILVALITVLVFYTRLTQMAEMHRASFVEYNKTQRHIESIANLPPDESITITIKGINKILDDLSSNSLPISEQSIRNLIMKAQNNEDIAIPNIAKIYIPKTGLEDRTKRSVKHASEILRRTTEFQKLLKESKK